MKWIDLLGTPFKRHGTGKDGLDCTTVAEEILRRLGKTPPPTTPHRFARKTSREIGDYFAAMADSYALVGRGIRDAKALGDVVLSKDKKGRPISLFVLVEEGGTFLTSDHICGVRSCARRQIENVVGVYRLKELAT